MDFEGDKWARSVTLGSTEAIVVCILKQFEYEPSVTAVNLTCQPEEESLDMARTIALTHSRLDGMARQAVFLAHLVLDDTPRL